MIPARRVISSIFLAGVSFLSVLYQASCSSPVKPPAGKPTAATGQFNFYVNFNGPWAFMQDPDDASKIVAIAPFIADHESAYAAAINETPINQGIYEVTGPPSSPMTVDPQLVVVKDSISKARFSDVATNAGGARYMIRLPMPSNLTAYRIGREAVATSWPVPNPGANEKLYTTHMTMHYNVSGYTGIKLAGAADNKKPLDFTPVIGETGTLDIGVGPLYDLKETSCHDHGKAAFKALVGLFKVHQFIDFPGPDGQYNQVACGASDPQKPGGPMGPSPSHLGRTGSDCKAAMLLLTVTP
jgi:hypothetical protein